jgi:hypothetical protein
MSFIINLRLISRCDGLVVNNFFFFGNVHAWHRWGLFFTLLTSSIFFMCMRRKGRSNLERHTFVSKHMHYIYPNSIWLYRVVHMCKFTLQIHRSSESHLLKQHTCMCTLTIFFALLQMHYLSTRICASSTTTSRPPLSVQGGWDPLVKQGWFFFSQKANGKPSYLSLPPIISWALDHDRARIPRRWSWDRMCVLLYTCVLACNYVDEQACSRTKKKSTNRKIIIMLVNGASK